MTRRGLMALVGGLTVGGASVTDAVAGLLSGHRVRAVADAQPLPAVSQPTIVGCDQWQAREPSSPVKVLQNRPVRILVHHTATENRNDDTESQLATLAKSIQDFHMDRNGWIDSGHHFLVNRAGLIAEGRHKSLESLLGGQKFIEGAHCPDQNDTAIGIENQGLYTKADPPGGMLSGLRALCAYACLQYGIDPEQLYGHRDYRDTDCPGDKLYALLPWLRNQVGRMMGRGTEWRAATLATWPLVRPADQGPVVLAAQHLLRNAGVSTVPADGMFGQATSDGVRTFQQAHGLELTGMIAGGSWPLLAVEVRAGQGGEAEAAVQALLARQGAEAVTAPPVVRKEDWQRLLAS
ncbi:peptidoglycan recognition protein family protein [Pseudonocardia acaciae]|uniref:peptidoglycan recognition protein family protein n=1 Tax=Pseudonocardia acaciae TaxID=551276 RepID=UPI000B10B5F6|nr:N-acetylmuramoyl-L-alanine amidase [Pseudonocardia acaciae]